MQRTLIVTTQSLSDTQMVNLLRYTLSLKASLGLATTEDFRVLKELLYYREPVRLEPRIEAAQLA